MENEIVILQDYIEKRNNFDKSISNELKVHNQKNKIEQISELFNYFLQSEDAQKILNSSDNHEEQIYQKISVNKGNLDDNINIDNNCDKKYKEAELEMKRIKSLNKEHMEFLLVSFLTIIFSLIGLLIFSLNGFYIIHPSIYLLGLLMGIGWVSTALMSIYKHRGDK